MKRRAYSSYRSQQLDWAILMVEATRGWRRLWWRLVKRWRERWV